MRRAVTIDLQRGEGLVRPLGRAYRSTIILDGERRDVITPTFGLAVAHIFEAVGYIPLRLRIECDALNAPLPVGCLVTCCRLVDEISDIGVDAFIREVRQ